MAGFLWVFKRFSGFSAIFEVLSYNYGRILNYKVTKMKKKGLIILAAIICVIGGAKVASAVINPVVERDKTCRESWGGSYSSNKCVMPIGVEGQVQPIADKCTEMGGTFSRPSQSSGQCVWNDASNSGANNNNPVNIEDSNAASGSASGGATSDGSSGSSGSTGSTGSSDASSGASNGYVGDNKCTSILPGSWCGKGGIESIIQLVVDILTGLVVVAGTIGIIVCGIMWMTARDNESQVATAKRRIFEIAIGLVAWVLLSFIIGLILPNGKVTSSKGNDYNNIGYNKELGE